MDDIWKNNTDVEWSVVSLAGDPVLVLQTEGPVLSATFLGAEYQALQLRYVYDPDQFPKRVPTTFVCYEKDILSPILACDVDDTLRPLLQAVTEEKPWLLALQFVVEEEQQTRIFRTIKGTTHPVIGPDGMSVIPRWICQMV